MNERMEQVPKEKHEKLGGVVKKVFGQLGPIAEDGLTHPFDGAKGLTKGFAFVNYLQPQHAKLAVATLNGKPLDKNHKFKVKQCSGRSACYGRAATCRSHAQMQLVRRHVQ